MRVKGRLISKPCLEVTYDDRDKTYHFCFNDQDKHEFWFNVDLTQSELDDIRRLGVMDGKAEDLFGEIELK